jgi:hypothetical protein
MGSISFKNVLHSQFVLLIFATAIAIGFALPAQAIPAYPMSPFQNADPYSINDMMQRFGKAHQEAQCLLPPSLGGQAATNSDGSATMTSMTLSPLTKYPPMSATFQCSSEFKAMAQQYFSKVPYNGELSSDAKSNAASAYSAMMLARMMQLPSNAAAQSRAQTQGNTQAASDAMGQASTTQAANAIDYNTRYLQNFTSDMGNRWNQIRMNLFVPIAILLLLPGAVLTQMKVLKDSTGPMLDYVLPFEGIGRAVIAVFAIGASSLVPNYAIDFANSVSDGIASGYQQIVGSNMYADAIAFQARGTPVRTPLENQNAGNATTWPQNAIQDIPSFEKAMIYNVKVDNGQRQADPDRTNEAMPAGAAMVRFAAFGMNSALTCTWNILCAFQQAYLCYLFLVGPIACALWVWPIDGFRSAMPSWIEGCITICFWNLFWNTVILLMACFKGVDTTNTLLMTALNFLATASVKYAFDFASLVKAAGEEAGQMAQQGAQGGQQGGSAGGSGAGAKSGAGKKGGQNAVHGPNGPGHANQLHRTGLHGLAFGRFGKKEGGGPEGPKKPNPLITNASWNPKKGGPGGGECHVPPGGLPPLTTASMMNALHGGQGGAHFLNAGFSPGGEGGPRNVSEPGPTAFVNGPATHGGFAAAFGHMPGQSGEGSGFTDSPTGATLGTASFTTAAGGAAFSLFHNALSGNDGAGTMPVNVGGANGLNGAAGFGLNGENAAGLNGANGFNGNPLALQTADGNSLFFAPPGADGEDGMLLSPNGAGGFDAVPVGAAGGAESGEEAPCGFSAQPGPDGSWNVAYNSSAGVENFNVAANAEGNGFNVGHTVNGRDMGHSEINYGANGIMHVSEFGAGQTNPSAVHGYAPDGSSFSAYFAHGSTTPDLRTISQPITDGAGNSGYQTTYYGRDSQSPAGTVTHLDGANGGWTEKAFGPDGQPLSVSNQTINGDGTYTVSSQEYARDGSGSITGNESAVYSMDTNNLQSISNEINSPDMSQVMTSNAYFDANQNLVSASATSYENGNPVSSTDFARDSNNNYLERQTSFNEMGGVTGVVQAAFDPNGQLLGGQVSYPNSSVSDVAISRTADGEYYARQSYVSGESVAAHLTYDSSSNSWNTVQDNSFNQAAAYNVTAQDAYGTTNIQQQQPGDVIHTGTEGPPVVQHLPNADHMVQQTMASIEQLAAYWIDQRMQGQQTTEVRPLEPVYAAPIEGLGHVAYHGNPMSSYHTAEGGSYSSYASPAHSSASYSQYSDSKAPPVYVADQSIVYAPHSSAPPAESTSHARHAAHADNSPPVEGPKPVPQIDGITYPSQGSPSYASPSGDSANYTSYGSPSVDNTSYTYDSSPSVDTAGYTNTYTSPPIEGANFTTTASPSVEGAILSGSVGHSPLSVESVAPHLTYDATSNSWNTVQDTSFAREASYTVTAQDAYGPTAAAPDVYGPTNVQQQQPGDVIHTGAQGPPVVQHLPNADVMAQQTIASIEQLAAYWFDQRMQQQQTTEVKPLEPVFAAPFEVLSHGAYHANHTAEGGSYTSHASQTVDNSATVASYSQYGDTKAPPVYVADQNIVYASQPVPPIDSTSHAPHAAHADSSPPVESGPKAVPQIDGITYPSYASPSVDGTVLTGSASYSQHGGNSTTPVSYESSDQAVYVSHPHSAPPPEIVNNDYAPTVYPEHTYETTYDSEVNNHHAPPPAPPIYQSPPVENHYQSQVQPLPRPSVLPVDQTARPDSYQQNYTNVHHNVPPPPPPNNDARSAVYNSILNVQSTPIKSTLPPNHNPDTIKKIIDDLKNSAGETKKQDEPETWQSWAQW